jgi:hypothetical protein
VAGVFEAPPSLPVQSSKAAGQDLISVLDGGFA